MLKMNIVTIIIIIVNIITGGKTKAARELVTTPR